MYKNKLGTKFIVVISCSLLGCGGALSLVGKTPSEQIKKMHIEIQQGDCVVANKLASEYTEGLLADNTVETKRKKAEINILVGETCSLISKISDENESGEVLCNESFMNDFNNITDRRQLPNSMEARFFGNDFTKWLAGEIKKTASLCRRKREWWGQWQKVGNLSMQQVVQWQRFGFNPDTSMPWISENVSPEDARKWSSFLKPNEVRAVIDSKFSREQVLAWAKFFEFSRPDNLTSTHVASWLQSGMLPGVALDWRNVTHRADEAIRWFGAGFSPSEYNRWSETFKVEVAKKWVNQGYSFEEAQSWQGFTMDEAVEWKSAGLSADDATQFRGYSPKEAKRLNRKVRSFCKKEIEDADILSENPYSLKGRCLLANVENFQLLSPKSGLYKDIENDVLVFIQHSTTIPMEFDAIFYVSGVFKYLTSMQAEQIVPKLKPLLVLKH